MDGFEKWIQFVEQAARQAGKAFVYEIFEGNEMPNPPDGMEVQDLSGYLADPELVKGRIFQDVDDVTALAGEEGFEAVFAEWREQDGELHVEFVPAAHYYAFQWTWVRLLRDMETDGGLLKRGAKGRILGSWIGAGEARYRVEFPQEGTGKPICLTLMEESFEKIKEP